MTKRILIVVFCFFQFSIFAQKDSIAINPKYLEDQIYVGITYNIFTNTPPGFLDDGLAYGFQAGFIRDIPFNKRRNIGMGIGLGYNFNSYIQNILVQNDQANSQTETYKIKTNNISVPVQFRWRTSTLDKYKFWRIYTGVNLSYILNSNSSQTTEAVYNSKSVLNYFQPSYNLSAGYGSWNIFLEYGITPFFNDSLQFSDGSSLKLNSFKLGLMFYIL